MYIPIILLVIYIVYDYFYGTTSLKANMISITRKLGKDINSDQLKLIEDITKSCKI
jgi:hypothetical protein